jgi:aromatic-amino-acid transaminase
MICVAKTKEIADEFKRVCEFSSRGSWSNSAKVAQVILSRIYEEDGLLERVDAERAHFREMLLARGKAFEAAAKEVDLETVPFDAGFFISMPCDNPDEISAELEKEGIFIVPLAKGLRVSVASISEERCRFLPAKIKAAMDRLAK